MTDADCGLAECATAHCWVCPDCRGCSDDCDCGQPDWDEDVVAVPERPIETVHLPETTEETPMPTPDDHAAARPAPRMAAAPAERAGEPLQPQQPRPTQHEADGEALRRPEGVHLTDGGLCAATARLRAGVAECDRLAAIATKVIEATPDDRGRLSRSHAKGLLTAVRHIRTALTARPAEEVWRELGLTSTAPPTGTVGAHDDGEGGLEPGDVAARFPVPRELAQPDPPPAPAAEVRDRIARGALVCVGCGETKAQHVGGQLCPAPDPLPDHVEVARVGRGWVWRCWGDEAAGCTGWVGDGLDGERAAEVEARRHLREDHRAAGSAGGGE